MNDSFAVITGAASGIGLALVQACIQRNMHVLMVDHNADALTKAHRALCSQSMLEARVCDVTQFDAVKQLAKETYSLFQRVDLLINNAGINGPLMPVWEAPIEKVKEVVEVNLFGVLHGIQAYFPFLMKQDKRAHIVNMASVYGLCCSSLAGAYAMSKHAIVALSESLYFDIQARELALDVSVVCPSFVNTPLLSNAKSTDPLHQKMQALLLKGRAPDEIAAHILTAVAQKQFYILPDQEIKADCEKHLASVLAGSAPSLTGLEKLMAWVRRK